MNRNDFRKMFKSAGPVVLPVIHVLDREQAERNVRVLLNEGAAGCFLINHDFGVEQFLPIIAEVRQKFPSLWLGVNFLATTGKYAFPILGRMKAAGIVVDGYWADDACIDERRKIGEQDAAIEIANSLSISGWNGFYTGGTCFKKQREIAPEFYGVAARLATSFTDAVCTSGPATGVAADTQKIETFREAIGDHALLLASGVTPENVHHYLPNVDGFLVATGINAPGDFYNIQPRKLARLLTIVQTYGGIAQ